MSYKVVTVTAITSNLNQNNFREEEYPVLDGYLQQGYVVKDTIPILKPADESYQYAIVFILKKV